MKSPQLLFFLTPLACLLAQTPPPSQPATAPPADKPPTVSVQPASPAVAAPVPPDKVVLTIGDEKITAAEFDRLVNLLPEQYRQQMRTTGRRRFAEYLIDTKTRAQEARRRKLDETQAFKDQLAFQSEQVLAQVILPANLQATATVDEAASRAYYEEHKLDYVQVKARHILIRFKGSPVPLRKDQKELTEEEALAKAQEIRKKLVDGGDFDALAKAESDDVGSGAKGGDLGMFGHGRMTPAFETAAFTLPVGEISQPVKSPFGYHIIKVEQRQEKTWVEVRPEMEKKLASESVKKALDDLKRSTPTFIDGDFFGPPPAAPPVPGRPSAPSLQPAPAPAPAPSKPPTPQPK